MYGLYLRLAKLKENEKEKAHFYFLSRDFEN